MSPLPESRRLPGAETACFIAGTALAGIVGLGIGIAWFLAPSLAAASMLQVAAHLALGKETGIPVGLAAGLSPVASASLGFAQDATVLLLGYRLASALGRGLLKARWLQRFVPIAEGHVRFTRRTEAAGIAFLAGSLWIPFLPSGALVAALIGKGLGYRPGRLIPALLVSVLLATLTYTTLIAYMFTSVDDPRILWTFIVGAALITALVGAFAKWRPRPASV